MRVYQSAGDKAIKAAEKALQRGPWSNAPDGICGQTLLHLLNEFNVPMFCVELNGDEQSGPWLSLQAAEDYIDMHIAERGVCDDAYDRVRQEYDISDADGEPVE
jgi:hypothetical protein